LPCFDGVLERIRVCVRVVITRFGISRISVGYGARELRASILQKFPIERWYGGVAARTAVTRAVDTSPAPRASKPERPRHGTAIDGIDLHPARSFRYGTTNNA